jgi:hypothetical protein
MSINGTHQLLVNADDVNLLGESVQTIKKNTAAFLVGSKETGLEENIDTTWSGFKIKMQNEITIKRLIIVP